jgi:hypothetical protein
LRADTGESNGPFEQPADTASTGRSQKRERRGFIVAWRAWGGRRGPILMENAPYIKPEDDW